MAQLVSRRSCVADRLPVVVRFPAGPRVRLKTVDPPKGDGLGHKKKTRGASCCGVLILRIFAVTLIRFILSDICHSLGRYAGASQFESALRALVDSLAAWKGQLDILCSVFGSDPIGCCVSLVER